MISAAVIDRYAKAIFELGVESGRLTELSNELRNVADAYTSSRELRAVADNPLILDAERDTLLKDLAARLGAGEIATNTLRLLAKRRRIAALPDIARRLSTLADERAGIVRARVISAVPLSEDFYTRITQKLEAQMKKKIVVEREQDPSLIAGIVTKIGDNTIDGSLKGRLQDLERVLMRT